MVQNIVTSIWLHSGQNVIMNSKEYLQLNKKIYTQNAILKPFKYKAFC